MQILELRGIRSLGALRAYSALMLGLKMLPAYMAESYEDFLGRAEEMPPEDLEKLLREAVLFVPIDQADLEDTLSFCLDANKVPYSKENLKSLGLKDLHEKIVAVCAEVAKIKINLVSDAEKKKSLAGRLIREQPSSSIPS